jgi:hypothetical protein
VIPMAYIRHNLLFLIIFKKMLFLTPHETRGNYGTNNQDIFSFDINLGRAAFWVFSFYPPPPKKNNASTLKRSIN